MPIKILTLGDSLTRGDDATPGSFRTYRGRLYQSLVAAGYDVDFVGSSQAPPAIGGDPDCEAYGGASMDTTLAGVTSLKDRLPTVLVAPLPDIIIVYAGWNDVYNVPANIAARYVTFISDIQTRAPNAKVVMCTLHPQRGETESQTASALSPQYGALNAQIRALADAGLKRYVADLAALSSDTDLTSWVNAILDDIKLQPDFWNGGGITNAIGGSIPNAYGGIESASFAGMAAANALWSSNPPNPGNAPGGQGLIGPQSAGAGNPTFINNVKCVVPWPWVHAAQGHTSTNTGVEQRNLFAMVRRSNGQWVTMFSGARTYGSIWDGSYAAQCVQRLQNDGITTFVKPAGDCSVETWAKDTSPSRGILEFFGAQNREAVADATCFLMGCQMRLALDNPNGTNDMSQSRIIAKVGFDMSANIGGYHYDWLGFPRNSMDGGSGRYKHIKSTQWEWVTTCTVDAHWNDNLGIPPPWGFWSGEWVYANSPTYAITEAQFRANPPPLPAYRENTSSVGSGYTTGDYWDVIHPLQSGADKFAQVILSTLVSNNLLTGGNTTPPPPGSILSRPSKANWALRATSGRANWRVGSTQQFTAPVLTTSTYPAVVRTVAYSATSSATGTSPITWAASGLPSGLSMASNNGDITGTTSATAGDYTVTITLTNAGAPTGVQFTRTITVQAISQAPTITTPETIPTAAVRNQLFTYGLAATGTGPFSWSAVGNMPTGFELLTDGTVRGIGRTSGVFSFTAKVTGFGGAEASRIFTLLVSSNATDRWVRLSAGTATWVRLT